MITHCVQETQPCAVTIKAEKKVNQLRVYPKGNNYLETGLSALLTHFGSKVRRMTFIDFSVANYKCFFDPLFFNETLKKNTCTIFVVDRQLGPVANYWASLLPNINGIIYSHDSLAVVMQKIKDVIQGKRLLIHHGETLSRVQMDVFRYVMSGISIQNISKVICLSDKRVYGIKTEIETKLKGSLNHLIIGSSHARTSRDLFTPQGNEK